MIWAVTFGTFLATVAVCLSLYFAFTPRDQEIARRLTDLKMVARLITESFAEKQIDRLRALLIRCKGTLFLGEVEREQLRSTTAMMKSRRFLPAWHPAAVRSCEDS